MSELKPPSALRFANRLLAPLIRSGVRLGVRRAPMALLSVTGRKSGLVRTTPVSLVETEMGWLLVAVYGVSDWSRNLEAAGRASIITRGSTTKVRARRMGPAEGRAPPPGADARGSGDDPTRDLPLLLGRW